MPPQQCMVHKCRNKSDQGYGLNLIVTSDKEGVSSYKTWVCYPCWETMISGKGKHSQVRRNVEIAQLSP